MKTACATIIAASTLLLWLGTATPDDVKPAPQPTEKEVSRWMQSKAGLSQQVLQGLTEENFDKISRAAVLMNVLSYFEGRERSEDPDYKRYLSQFNSANRELVRMSNSKNLEGATLAFNQLTVSCVSCHRTLRNTPTEEK